jgi:hypothetical protein
MSDKTDDHIAEPPDRNSGPRPGVTATEYALVLDMMKLHDKYDRAMMEEKMHPPGKS